MEKLIYLDNASTTFPKPESVYIELDKTYRNMGINAGRSSYTLARQANIIIDDSKEKLLKLVNSQSGKVVFTPSATIALNEIIAGLDIDSGQTVYVSPFEHNAVMRPLHYYSEIRGFKYEVLPYNEDFELDIDKMKYMFSRNKPDYVILSHVSNVTGHILDIEEINSIVKGYEGLTIVDASQSIGLLPLDLNEQKIDLLVFAGHKTLYGPFGVGGYINNSNIKLRTLLYGGTGSDSLNLKIAEHSQEVGSPNIAAISGLNSAIEWINNENIQNITRKKKELTERLIVGLESVYEITTFLPKDRNKHIGIVSFTHREYNPDELGQILDEDYNIAVRTGYHCAPLIHDLIKTKDEGGTVRVSLGYFNTEEDIDKLIESLSEL